MIRFSLVVLFLAVTALLIIGWAPSTPRYVFDQQSRPRSSIDMDALTAALREYGIWREQHDRNTFPSDMPKVGETYDPVTGNAVRE
jgi:hypothetical protein